ncbi:phage holin family protein [Pedobacter flavus]|uniref:Phage holin family protein n=1 Tax=Pedobacter flavus TaxID=3113906 RepID=A0ABU7GZL0_9SPHI|nr:phage holin family protein [Pedobacter sp. VNH31]MEE1884509.1 phage holin family protein [Pedobacter sp. VNH31]
MQGEEEKTINGLLNEAKEYLDNRIEYLRLVALEKVSRLFADLVTQVAFIISGILAFLFGSVTLAFFLSDILGSYTRGFGCVSLIYLFIAFIVFLTKDKYIEKSIVNTIIRKYLKKHSEEAENEKGL